MPVSPALAEDLAAVLGDLYRAAEYVLIDTIRRTLATGMGLPTWAEDKLAALGDLSSALTGVADALAGETAGTVREALSTAYDRGQQAAVAELGAVAAGQAAVAAAVLPTAPVVDRLAAGVMDKLTPVRTAILRQTQDVYRSVIAEASAAPALGIESRRQATQRALNRFVDRGVVNFVDSRGRGWGMAEYAEMALRTSVGRAAIEAHSDRLDAADVQLVMVSDQPLHCPKCDKWAGKILWRGRESAAATVMLEHATEDGKWARVTIAGSLAEARASGLLHPNCRCSIAAYLPGVSTPPQSIPHPGGATYKDTQRQRALERETRKWKKRELAALDEPARKAAGAKVRAAQGKIRELTGEKGLKRKPERERPMTGHAGQGGPGGRPTPRPKPAPAPETPAPPAPTPEVRPTPTPLPTPVAPATGPAKTSTGPVRPLPKKMPALNSTTRSILQAKADGQSALVWGAERERELTTLHARGLIDADGRVTPLGHAQVEAFPHWQSGLPIDSGDLRPGAMPRAGRRNEAADSMTDDDLYDELQWQRKRQRHKDPAIAEAAKARVWELNGVRQQRQLDNVSPGFQ